MCQCKCLRRLLVGAGLAQPSKEDDAELLSEIDVTTEEGLERFLERFELPDCHNPRDLTGDDRQRLLRLFDFFDLDKERHISKRELRIGLSALGQPPTDSDAKRMIAQLDLSRGRSGDGQVDFEEFCLGLLHRRCDLYLVVNPAVLQMGAGVQPSPNLLRSFVGLVGRMKLSDVARTEHRHRSISTASPTATPREPDRGQWMLLTR